MSFEQFHYYKSFVACQYSLKIIKIKMQALLFHLLLAILCMTVSLQDIVNTPPTEGVQDDRLKTGGKDYILLRNDNVEEKNVEEKDTDKISAITFQQSFCSVRCLRDYHRQTDLNLLRLDTEKEEKDQKEVTCFPCDCRPSCVKYGTCCPDVTEEYIQVNDEQKRSIPFPSDSLTTRPPDVGNISFLSGDINTSCSFCPVQDSREAIFKEVMDTDNNDTNMETLSTFWTFIHINKSDNRNRKYDSHNKDTCGSRIEVDLSVEKNHVICEALPVNMDIGLNGTSVLVVRSCPREYANATTRRLCESESPEEVTKATFLRVIDANNFVVYYNEFCALCHQITEVRSRRLKPLYTINLSK